MNTEKSLDFCLFRVFPLHFSFASAFVCNGLQLVLDAADTYTYAPVAFNCNLVPMDEGKGKNVWPKLRI